MAMFIRKGSKDDIRLGDCAAKQPLSGTLVVTSIRVRGFNGNSFAHSEETKKSV